MPSENVHFFSGENEYALEKAVLHWKKAFTEKYGPENFTEIIGKDVQFSGLLDAVASMPFIAEKRLVLLRGVPRIEKDDVQVFLSSIHPQTIVLIADPKPDKRLGATKELLSHSQTKDFPLLTGIALFTWAIEILKAEGSNMDRTVFDRLVSIAGTDQWTLEAELRKLSAFSGVSIRSEHVDLLAVPSGEQVVWRLTDLIGSGKAEEALRFLQAQIERGEDIYGLWVIILSMIKNLTLVWSALQDGIRDERSIASAFGMHFLSVRGLLSLAKKLTKERVTDLVRFAADADIALKTGGYHYSADHQQEIISLTERLILKCR